MKAVKQWLPKILLVLLTLITAYIFILFFPEPLFENHVTVNNITVYSDEPLLVEKTTEIIKTAESKIQKSALYKKDTKHRLFIVNNPILWRFLTNINYNVGGINYIPFNHMVLLRKADVADNRLYGPSGNKVPDDRTLDYFIAHEMTHTLEFQSMPWYKYPIQTNWVLEGYADYIAHDSVGYSAALDKYLTVPESTSAKYYTRARTLVSYMLEVKKENIASIWSQTKEYDKLLREAIPNDSPKLSN